MLEGRDSCYFPCKQAVKGVNSACFRVPYTVSKIQFVRPEYPDPFSYSIATKGIKLPIKAFWYFKHFVQDRRLIQVDEIFIHSHE